MILLNDDQIQRLLNAQKICTNPDHAILNGYSEFVYDSRKTSHHSIFVCIPGKRVDGHDFIEQAIRGGAVLVLGENPSKLKAAAAQFPSVVFFLVKSVLESVQILAQAYRKLFSIPVIGVVGSNGKTTTKDLCARILNQHLPCLKTEASQNNHWGVPQTVLKLQRQHETAVFEIGTNHFGEVQELSEICQPTIALLTTVGQEHLEFLGDEQGSLKANRELFDWMLQNQDQGCFIFNEDHPLIAQFYDELKSEQKKGFSYFSYSLSDSNADFFLKSKSPLGFEKNFGCSYVFQTPFGEVAGEFPLPGIHNLQNALAATAAALLTKKVGPYHVADALAAPVTSSFRSRLFCTPQKKIMIYDDTYNANPTSFHAMFQAGHEIQINSAGKVQKIVAVVGDMFELGCESERFHAEVAQYGRSQGIEELIAIGSFAEAWKKGFPQAQTFSTQEAFRSLLKEQKLNWNEKTLVMVKGSRGARMDQIVELFEKQL